MPRQFYSALVMGFHFLFGALGMINTSVYITARSCLLTSCQDGPGWAFNLLKLAGNTTSPQAHVCHISRWILRFLLRNAYFLFSESAVHEEPPHLYPLTGHRVSSVLKHCRGKASF